MVIPCPPQAIADHIDSIVAATGLPMEEVLIRFMSSVECIDLIKDVESGRNPVFLRDFEPTLDRVMAIYKYCRKYDLTLREGVRRFYGSGFNDDPENWAKYDYMGENIFPIVDELVRKNGTDYRYKNIFASL